MPVTFCPPLGEVVTAGPVPVWAVAPAFGFELMLFGVEALADAPELSVLEVDAAGPVAVEAPAALASWSSLLMLLAAVPVPVEADAWLDSIPAEELVGLLVLGAMLPVADALPAGVSAEAEPLVLGAACEVLVLQVLEMSFTLVAEIVFCSPVLAPLGAVDVAVEVVLVPPVTEPVTCTEWPTSPWSWVLSPVTWNVRPC